MKTIKVIDLLNKIANGEEVLEYIQYYNRIEFQKYKMLCEESNIIYRLNECAIRLNDEIEIIEEDKEIEEALGVILLGQCDNWLQKRDVNIKSDFELNPYILEAITDNFKSLYHKQCELVKAVNTLKKGK